MASIESLLNPVPSQAQYSLPSPPLTTLSTAAVTSRSPRQKRQKVPKDAAVFTEGKPRGKVRYPPCEERDEELAKRHREFQVYPMGNIADYPRHIPYNSDKKTFQEKTGRESFEVFQYTFKIPGNDKEWLIMWDYNIGLVRTTPLFRSQNYSKTTPAKVLDANPGLREISHSITGGAIVAQGYWIPFEAAKAAAATFCWRIRHALTPIFGLDFPSQCIHPQDRTRRFGQMLIDPAIVKTATETATFYRHLALQSASASAPAPAAALTLPAPPIRPLAGAYERCTEDERHRRRALIPRGYGHRHHASYADSVGGGGYGSSSEVSAADSYCVSPSSPFRNTFTPVNTPRSCEAVCSRVSSPRLALPALPGPGPGTVRVRVSRQADEGSDEEESGSSSSSSSSLYSDGGSSVATDCLSDLDRDGDNEYRDSESDGDGGLPQSRSRSEENLTAGVAAASKRKCTVETRSHRKPSAVALFAREVKAAHALLSLHMQDATASDEEILSVVRNQRKRRRASA